MKKVAIVCVALALSACTTTKLVPELVPLAVPEELMRPLPYELDTINPDDYKVSTVESPEVFDEGF